MKYIGGETFFGKKQPATEGFKSTASDPNDSANVFSIWIRASGKGKDDEIVEEPEIAEPEPALEISNVNLALNKPTSQSSLFDRHGESSKGVDGRKDCSGTYDEANSLTHTNKDYEAWWKVDLG
jgi:hypothetical protein